MSLLYSSMLQRFHFVAAMLALLVGIGAAIDLHTHETGLHVPTVCNICALENGLSGGCVPVRHCTLKLVTVYAAIELPESRLFAAAHSDFTPIRAPPLS